MKLTQAELDLNKKIEKRVLEIISYQKRKCTFRIRKQRKDARGRLGRCTLRFNRQFMRYEIIVYVSHEKIKNIRISTLIHELIHAIQYIFELNNENYKTVKHKEVAALYLENAYKEYVSRQRDYNYIIKLACNELNTLYGYNMNVDEFIANLVLEENKLAINVVAKEVIKFKKDFIEQYVDVL